MVDITCYTFVQLTLLLVQCVGLSSWDHLLRPCRTQHGALFSIAILNHRYNFTKTLPYLTFGFKSKHLHKGRLHRWRHVYHTGAHVTKVIPHVSLPHCGATSTQSFEHLILITHFGGNVNHFNSTAAVACLACKLRSSFFARSERTRSGLCTRLTRLMHGTLMWEWCLICTTIGQER